MLLPEIGMHGSQSVKKALPFWGRADHHTPHFLMGSAWLLLFPDGSCMGGADISAFPFTSYCMCRESPGHCKGPRIVAGARSFALLRS